MVSTVTPLPADIVVRSTMFHSWAIEVARGPAGLALSMRSGPAAAATGRWAGQLLQWVRPSWPGPEALEARFTEFFGNIAGVLHRRWPHAGGVAVIQPVVESAPLVAAVRFVGVDAADAPVILVVAAFLVAYPMTALPFFGIGVLDAAIVALIADRSSAGSTELVAALVVWRVSFQLVPLLLGAVTLVGWRLSSRRRGSPATTA